MYWQDTEGGPSQSTSLETPTLERLEMEREIRRKELKSLSVRLCKIKSPVLEPNASLRKGGK